MVPLQNIVRGYMAILAVLFVPQIWLLHYTTDELLLDLLEIIAQWYIQREHRHREGWRLTARFEPRAYLLVTGDLHEFLLEDDFNDRRRRFLGSLHIDRFARLFREANVNHNNGQLRPINPQAVYEPSRIAGYLQLEPRVNIPAEWHRYPRAIIQGLVYRTIAYMHLHAFPERQILDIELAARVCLWDGDYWLIRETDLGALMPAPVFEPNFELGVDFGPVGVQPAGVESAREGFNDVNEVEWPFGPHDLESLDCGPSEE